MSFNKKRRSDENTVNDTDIADFLHRKSELYKHIQLSCYLEKLASERSVPFTIDRTTSELFCLSIMEGIKVIIRKIFTDAKFGDDTGSNELYCVTNIDGAYIGILRNYYLKKYRGLNFKKFNFSIYHDLEDESKFFKISGESFDIYFLFLSCMLSTPTCTVTVTFSPLDCYSFEISILGY